MSGSKSTDLINANCRGAIMSGWNQSLQLQNSYLLHNPTILSLEQSEKAWKGLREYKEREQYSANINRKYDAIEAHPSPDVQQLNNFAAKTSIGSNFGLRCCNEESLQRSGDLNFCKSVNHSFSAFDDILYTGNQQGNMSESPRTVRHLGFATDPPLDGSNHQNIMQSLAPKNIAPRKKSDLVRAIEAIESYQFAAVEAKQALDVVSFASSLDTYRLQMLESELQALKDQLHLQMQYIVYLEQDRNSLLRNRSELMRYIETQSHLQRNLLARLNNLQNVHTTGSSTL
jgi:hypothetical protein